MLGKRKRGSIATGFFKRKKVSVAGPEEIKFDFSAREDYLTGFHKRKLQRIKHAQEQTAKKEREQKIADRKALREERKADAEKHVETVNALLKKSRGLVMGSEDSESDSGGKEWDGIAEPMTIDHEDEYSDADRHTTVTVEAVDVTRDGFRRAKIDLDGAALESSEDEAETKNAEGTLGETSTGKQRRVWTKEKPKQPRKKKKFRYETKQERKVTRMKEKSGGRAKAKARRRNE